MPNRTVRRAQAQSLCSICITGSAGVLSYWESSQVCEQVYSKEQHLKPTADALLARLCPITCVPCHPVQGTIGPRREREQAEVQQGCTAVEQGHNTLHHELSPAQQDSRKLNATGTWHNVLTSLPPLLSRLICSYSTHLTSADTESQLWLLKC